MSAHLVFCSHCGFAQNLESSGGTFVVQCANCRGVTMGLGTGWTSRAAETAGEISAGIRQMEYSCPECQSGVRVEILQNTAHVACTRCSQMNNWCASEPAISMPATKLTIEELAFLGQTAT